MAEIANTGSAQRPQFCWKPHPQVSHVAAIDASHNAPRRDQRKIFPLPCELPVMLHKHCQAPPRYTCVRLIIQGVGATGELSEVKGGRALQFDWF